MNLLPKETSYAEFLCYYRRSSIFSSAFVNALIRTFRSVGFPEFSTSKLSFPKTDYKTSELSFPKVSRFPKGLQVTKTSALVGFKSDRA